MIRLLAGIFDAEVLRRYDQPDGSVMHVELRIDDTVIMVADATDEYPANQLLIHVYVADVHETFQKALNLGCELIQEPMNKGDDPDMRGMFGDFQGNIWAVATQTKKK